MHQGTGKPIHLRPHAWQPEHVLGFVLKFIVRYEQHIGHSLPNLGNSILMSKFNNFYAEIIFAKKKKKKPGNAVYWHVIIGKLDILSADAC